VFDEWQAVSQDEVSNEVEIDQDTRACAEGDMDAALLDLQPFAHRTLDEEDVLRASDRLHRARGLDG